MAFLEEREEAEFGLRSIPGLLAEPLSACI